MTRERVDEVTDMHATHWGGPGEDYRLSKISSATIDSTDGVSAPAPDDAAPVWQPPKAAHSFPWFEVVMTTIGVLGTIGIIIYGLAPESSSVTAFVKTTLLSLVALVIVVGFLQRIDRWEPEPWTTKLAMFLWGGGVATLTSMITNTALHTDIAFTIGDLRRAEALAMSFIAPLVEETFKGIGVLIIVVVRRNSINSVLDGVVYAGFSAAGFLFFEDILYFLRTEGQGTKTLVLVFVLRALAGPFLHVMATSMTGIGLALALIKFRRGWSKTAIVVVFWFAAMLIHFAWNGSIALPASGTGFIVMYLVVGIPGFVLWSVLLLRAARREALHIRDGLVPYVRTGWILPGEVSMATDRRARQAAFKWTAQGGRDAKRAMRAFLSDLASLGLDQRLMARHGADRSRIENDRRMLADAVEKRREFLRLTSIAEQQKDVTNAVAGRAQVA
ncbi:PrsW family intramembrane metalloprotease [Schaalia odontolytica]|uniref:PrsW family intramembrane metalloprotease n=2 Tax=Schaalia odontolytica TaxID=1660 RepID=A0A857A6H2_9ACTO|nr:PrsW family intramembrane metalloprotease [Schaalia odontolytica]EFF79137.1 hypothetical protein HMPREF0970_01938 [Schaalia odontolytica F0309]QGS10921.1 PrsW family intramembrane metalloprotease [Schaalia odontolytica]